MNKNAQQGKGSGFGMILAILALVLLAVVGCIVFVAVAFIAYIMVDESKVPAAYSQMSTFRQAIGFHKLHTGEYPRELDHLIQNSDQLEEWQGPYLEANTIPLDPWGNQFQYRIAGDTYTIVCFGPDAKQGGNDDITLLGE